MNDAPLAFADVPPSESVNEPQSEPVRETIATEGTATASQASQAPPSDRPAIHAETSPAPSTLTSTPAAVAKPKAGKGRTGMLTAWLIAAAVLLYVVLATLAVDWMSGAIVMLGRHQHVIDVSLTTTLDAWEDANASGDRRAMKAATLAVVFPTLLFVIALPVALLAATRKRRELYGSARFATAQEVLNGPLMRPRGIILGKLRGRYLMMDGELSVMLAAPPGAGKGAGVVVPNLLTWPESAVVLDVKPELFRITAGYRAAHGQKVFCWSPFDKEGRSHGYNPLSYIRTDYRYVVGDILNIAQILYAGKSDDSSASSFFLGNARNLFLGLALYLLETPELPRTIGEILRLASGKGQPIKDFLHALIDDRKEQGRPLSPRCEDALRRVLSAGEGDTFGSIVNTFNEPLTLFTDALVDAATSTNDFDLRELRRQRMSVYVEIPVNRIGESKVLLALLYAQLLKLNTAEDHENDPSIKYHLLMVDDEFATLGRVAAFTDSVGYLRSFWIRLLTIVQSPAQLEMHYGKEATRAFLTCHGARIVMTPRDQKDAEEVSAFLGHLTEQSRSRSSSSGRGGGSTSTNTSVQKRPLMFAQELREMPGTQEIVLLDDCKPILAEKIRYFEDPAFTSRLMPPPEVPRIDLELFQARIEGRAREVGTDELFTVEDLVANFHALPAVAPDAREAELHTFVGAFLNQLMQRTEQPEEAVPTAQASNPGPGSDEDSERDSDTTTDARSDAPSGGPRVRRGRAREPRNSGWRPLSTRLRT